MLIRSVEQKLLELFSQGKLFGTIHSCIGQEWTGIALAEALLPDDVIFSNHRAHGHFLARTDDVNGLIAELMGKKSGVCGGRGGSQHLFASNFFTNGVQGGIVPVAAGIAFAQKLRGASNIAVAIIGDGTLGEGAVYETLNIASKWSVPLLIVLENNHYAQSTPQTQTLAGEICARAKAFDIRTERGNTWCPQVLLELTNECVSFVRNECRPLFLQIDTYRLMPHSKGDDQRNPQEVASYWEKDPIAEFMSSNPQAAAQMQSEIDARIDTASSLATADDFCEPVVPNSKSVGTSKPTWRRLSTQTSDRVVNRIHAALRQNMSRDSRIVLLGEDIEGPYGGAFKVTKDLSQDFPDHVWNTPISEAAVVGIGNGLALSGFLPVCEIMFGDFLMLAADQLINHAAKFAYIYNDQVRVPLIVRTPMGGRRGYGPTHSQSLEKHFLGIPGTLMLAVNHRYDPALVYDAVFNSIDCPTIVIENKTLYAAKVSNHSSPGFVWESSDELFPTVRLHPETRPDLILLCYGGMLPEVEKAVDTLLDQHEIVCEIVCPLQLYPLDHRPIIESLRQCGRLLIVEEGQNFAGFGAEVISRLHEDSPRLLKCVRRIGPPSHPIPCCGPLENRILPGENHIVRAALEMLNDE